MSTSSSGDIFPESPVVLAASRVDDAGAVNRQYHRSHDRFKSVFNHTGKSVLASSARKGSGRIPSRANNDHTDELINTWTLLFQGDEGKKREVWFAARFYYHNRHTALLGALVMAVATSLMTSIIFEQPRLDSPIYRVPMIMSLSLTVVAAATAIISLFLQHRLLPAQPSNQQNEVVKKDPIWFAFFSWWEVSLFITHLGTIALGFVFVVAKRVGCLGADSIDDPIANQRCITVIQFDAAIILPIIAHGLVFPVRWILHLPVTMVIIVIFFGIRCIPGLSVVDGRFLVTTAFILSIPLIVFLLIRYRRERDLRRLFLSELQLEATLEHLSVLSARHETLLVPWVPLPIEEQVLLLRHGKNDHLWGIGSNTVVGVVQLANFAPWVAQAGACEAARTLSALVATVDNYYDLLAPIARSILKCHVDGDRYILVCPYVEDIGMLLLTILSACEHDNSHHVPHRPMLCAAVTCGLLGVVGIGASGTLIPAGPAMDRVSSQMANWIIMLQQRDVNHHDACQHKAHVSVTEDVLKFSSHLDSAILSSADLVPTPAIDGESFTIPANHSAPEFPHHAVATISGLRNAQQIHSVDGAALVGALKRDRFAAIMQKVAPNSRCSSLLVPQFRFYVDTSSHCNGQSLESRRGVASPFGVQLRFSSKTTMMEKSEMETDPSSSKLSHSRDNGVSQYAPVSSVLNHAGSISRNQRVTIGLALSVTSDVRIAPAANPLAPSPQAHSQNKPNADTSTSLEKVVSASPKVHQPTSLSIKSPATIPRYNNTGPPPSATTTISSNVSSPLPTSQQQQQQHRSNLATTRRFFLLLYVMFVDPDVERRFEKHTRDNVSNTELQIASLGSAAMAMFLIVIGSMYFETTIGWLTPMSFSVAALVVSILLVVAANLHSVYPQQKDVILVIHEFLFICFYATVVGVVFASEPNTSPLGDTQIPWLFMLMTLNFVRPRAHGFIPHIALETAGSIVFTLQTILYPHKTKLMRYINIVCDVAVALGPLYVHALLDGEQRQRFTIEVSLEELHKNLVILNSEINTLLVTTRVNNPAAIFAGRAQARQSNRKLRQKNDDASPLRDENVDPSTSTTTASRIMDTGVLLIEFAAAVDSPLVTAEHLKASVAKAKHFIASVDHLLEAEYRRALRIVKATPTSLLILSDVSVVGRSAAPKNRNASDLPLLELGLDVVRTLCPQHGLVGRSVVDSGPLVGVLLGSSSISFEFTGPVVERVRALLHVAPWGACFVTRRLLRYCGVDSDSTICVTTPSGMTGRTSGSWEPWRVKGLPKVSVATVV